MATSNGGFSATAFILLHWSCSVFARASAGGIRMRWWPQVCELFSRYGGYGIVQIKIEEMVVAVAVAICCVRGGVVVVS